MTEADVLERARRAIELSKREVEEVRAQLAKAEAALEKSLEVLGRKTPKVL